MDGGTIMFLVTIFVPAGVWIVAVRSESSGEYVTRIEFFGYFLVAITVGAFAVVLADHVNAPAGRIITAAVASIVNYLFAPQTVRRCRDAGWDKTLAYLAVIPFVGFFIFLALIFKGSADGSAKSGAFGVVERKRPGESYSPAETFVAKKD